MGFRSVSVKTNMKELEDLAAEAAACPREHLIKHFMLEACSVSLKQKMKPFLFLSLTEFKLKLKLIVQEENSRFSQNGFRKVNQIVDGQLEFEGNSTAPQGNGQA